MVGWALAQQTQYYPSFEYRWAKVQPTGPVKCKKMELTLGRVQCEH